MILREWTPTYPPKLCAVLWTSLATLRLSSFFPPPPFLSTLAVVESALKPVAFIEILHGGASLINISFRGSVEFGFGFVQFSVLFGEGREVLRLNRTDCVLRCLLQWARQKARRVASLSMESSPCQCFQGRFFYSVLCGLSPLYALPFIQLATQTHRTCTPQTQVSTHRLAGRINREVGWSGSRGRSG